MSQQEEYRTLFNLMLKQQLNTLLALNQRLNQVSQPSLQDQALRLYCFLYDRAPIPLEFWSPEAAAPYVTECLQSAQISIGHINKHAIKKWAARLHMPFKNPLVVTEYTPSEGVTKFSLEAWRTRGGPELAELQAAVAQSRYHTPPASLPESLIENGAACLRNLSAYRLLQIIDWQQAESFTAKNLGKPLFSGEQQWEKARSKARTLVEYFRPQMLAMLEAHEDLRFLEPLSDPIQRLEWDFSSCPEDELWVCVQYEYGREAVRVGNQ